MIQFKRYPHRVGIAVSWTKRRASLAKSKPMRNAKKASKKIPLFSEILEEEAKKIVVDIDEAKQLRQDNQDYFINKRRQFHADMWRQARKEFMNCDKETQKAILDKWNSFTYRHIPKESTRFAGLIDQLSGEQARRLKKCDLEYQVWVKAKNKNSHIQQLLF